MEHLLNVKTCCRPRTSFVMWPLLLMLLFGLMRKKNSSFSICSFLSFMKKCGFSPLFTHHLILANYDCPIVNYITQCLTLIQTSVFWRSINPIAEWCAMWGEKKGKTWKDLVNYYETRNFFLPNPHKGNLCLSCWLAVELNVEFVFLVFIGIDPLCIISLINLEESIQYNWVWLYETYRQKVKKKTTIFTDFVNLQCFSCIEMKVAKSKLPLFQNAALLHISNVETLVEHILWRNTYVCIHIRIMTIIRL